MRKAKEHEFSHVAGPCVKGEVLQIRFFLDGVGALPTMRYGGVLPGAATTAPAQHISSVAAVERSISETGAAQELRGVEPSALRRVRERLQAREGNAALGALTPLESSLVSDIELINTARVDPDVQGLRLRGTRDESRHLSSAATVDEARRSEMHQ